MTPKIHLNPKRRNLRGKRERRRKKTRPLIHWAACLPLFNYSTGASHICIFFSDFHTLIHIGPSALRLPTPSPVFCSWNRTHLSVISSDASFSMKTPPSICTHLLSQKWVHPLLTSHDICLSVLSYSPHHILPWGWITSVHVFIPILDYKFVGRDYISPFASLWTPSIESGIVCWLNQWMHEWIQERKEQWCDVMPWFLPKESILTSAYWLWILSLDQADARLSNTPFSLSFSILTNPIFFSQIWWMKTRGCLEV